MRHGKALSTALVVMLLAFSGPAAAQPEPTEDPYYEEESAPPPPPPAVTPAPPHDPRAARQYHRNQQKQAHYMLLDTDPEYRAARSKRTTGIVLTCVGGVSFLVGAIAGMVYGICQSIEGGSSCREAAWWTIGGLGAGAVGLAVGISMTVSGHRRMKEIRARAIYHGGLVPRVSLAPGPGGGHVGLTWEF
jgi:hypothetical protein